MKKLLLSIVVIILSSSSVIFSKSYDLSKISRVKPVKTYSVETTVDQMDTVTFGSYPQSDSSGVVKEPIEWLVLDRYNNKFLLLSKYILDCKYYENSYSVTTWETCTLRSFLNNDFYNQAFSVSEQNQIQTTHNVNKDAVTYPYNISSGTYGGNDTYDKVFCLSFDEAKNILRLMVMV